MSLPSEKLEFAIPLLVQRSWCVWPFRSLCGQVMGIEPVTSVFENEHFNYWATSAQRDHNRFSFFSDKPISRDNESPLARKCRKGSRSNETNEHPS